ncbi:hypothetical protein [Andreprevotia chitinilytica]|uniref:hypothetical protein n=1 Tax=Andreprevotia chitinilytica TaxID=396808 RepID=UPI000554190B|nr:hypothetical protein [Andreprevotia chitinilytica]
MIVDHVLIIAFPKQGEKGDPETMRGARALHHKYAQRKSTPQSCRVITVWHNNFKKSGTLDDPLKSNFTHNNTLDYQCEIGNALVDGKVEQAVAESNNVGVYIICHGHGNRPTIFGGQGSAMRVDGWKMSDMASAIANLLYELGIRNIRKLCLLMCGISGDSSGDPLFISMLPTAIHSKLGTSPIMAGYDSYVSIFHKTENDDYGRKMVESIDKFPSKTPELKIHKKFYVYNNGVKEVRSGWSDKPEEKEEKCLLM